MVSNLMFKKSIGESRSINGNSIATGGGCHDASRVSHAGYPGSMPKVKVPEGAPKQSAKGAIKAPPLKEAAKGKVEPPSKGNGK